MLLTGEIGTENGLLRVLLGTLPRHSFLGLIGLCQSRRLEQEQEGGEMVLLCSQQQNNKKVCLSTFYGGALPGRCTAQTAVQRGKWGFCRLSTLTLNTITTPV